MKSKLPLGIQAFSEIRKGAYKYVDKTGYIYKLVSSGKQFFLSRPRRFGKSVFLSTLKSYFEGQRELFEECSGKKALGICNTETEWTDSPVFYFDFNVSEYRKASDIEGVLNNFLVQLENTYGKDESETTYGLRFAGLIRRASNKNDKQIAVLVDEYDKPLLETMTNKALNEEYRSILKGFYGVLKGADPYIRFVFVTGVTKFSQVSIFSDLNHLVDISMTRDYSGICGITEAELFDNFSGEIEELAKINEISPELAIEKLKDFYNGYMFHKDGEKVYNPFSLLNAFNDGDFKYYWFKTGTPTFIVYALKENNFEIQNLDNSIIVRADAAMDYRLENKDIIPLLYQSGYLTIKSGNSETEALTLGFPNAEVRYGFFNELMPAYTPWVNDRANFDSVRFNNDLLTGDIVSFMERLRSFFADIPYELNTMNEKHFQLVLYLLFRLLGQNAKAEYHTSQGSADLVIEFRDMVYIIEVKLLRKGLLQNMIKAALKQIGERGYAEPFLSGDKKIMIIAVAFDVKTRTVGKWKAVTLKEKTCA
jgi:Holliday junction resolvase-like predicted endonuclease